MKRLEAILWLSLAFVAACSADGSANTLWPLPMSVSASGGPIPLSKSFAIHTESKSALLKRGIDRYSKLIIPNMDGEVRPDAPALTRLNVEVSSDEEVLNADTLYTYNISVKDAAALIGADTPFGALYALETFSQLVSSGMFNFSQLTVHDGPRFRHRGFMIDTGRRFYPKEFVMQLLDAMSYLKMNVLHFHLSDLCRFAVESKLYPQLASASNGFYTQQEIVDLVAYAKDRGIRVMPEFDVPGHSHGFLPLASSGDIIFCSSGNTQLYMDPENKTLTTLKNLFLEMAQLFEEKLFHLGCDETGTPGNCSLDSTKLLEEALVQHMTSIGKTPAGWEEILYRTGAASSTTVIDTWSRHNSSESTSQGFYSIESAGRYFYLNHATYENQWVDIATGMSVKQQELLLGGEMSMWTDNYCYIQQCINSASKPTAWWMYDRNEDETFMQSVGGMVWPRGIAAAGSFWNYNSSLPAASSEFLERYNAQNERLAQRGIAVCPNGCHCDELTRCGKPYPHSSMGN